MECNLTYRYDKVTAWEFASAQEGSSHGVTVSQPKDLIAERVEMIQEIINNHYDKATENMQMEGREGHLFLRIYLSKVTCRV